MRAARRANRTDRPARAPRRARAARAGRLSRRAARACRLLGFVPPPASAPPDFRAAARRLLGALGPGELAFVTGASGCGKSRLLRAVRRAERAAGSAQSGGGRVVTLGLGGSPGRRRRDARARRVLDATPGPLARALERLARAGLAEAPLLMRPAGALSEGERWRWQLACALGRTRRGGLLIVDEFASLLDRTCARAVAHALSRARHGRDAGGTRVVVASAHDDLLDALHPDVLVIPRAGGDAVIERRRA